SFQLLDRLRDLSALVVDHNPLNRSSLCDPLREWKVSVAEADSAEQAMALVKPNGATPPPFQLILVNPHLKDGGYEFIETLRRD
ncbi:MAG: hypothetical protein GWM98_05455, partial [Nitrospinaceae bacterium]|nr:response regulator [Nitrospinaceae bacterium]NIR54015.1 response regulator [Nitrospinaceae bacterium]NIS84434.1 response regulator [Nitrospinaceae bacterium]NIT81225.1 response regulator [Nitrospinaceae bacterium]NIU43514.1 response regulator [Nitrospinaceae bacterium]